MQKFIEPGRIVMSVKTTGDPSKNPPAYDATEHLSLGREHAVLIPFCWPCGACLGKGFETVRLPAEQPQTTAPSPRVHSRRGQNGL